MEFACEFVYISPGARIPSGPSEVKRSALLPPRNRRYLHSPTATPPKPVQALKPPIRTKPPKQCPTSPPVPTTPKPHIPTNPCTPAHSSVYENLQFHLQIETPPTPTTHTAEAPPLPPRPSFLKRCPEYGMVIPASSPGSDRDRLSTSTDPASEGESEKEPLPGNPNVILVNLGKLVGEDQAEPVLGEPSSCLGCGSVLESSYDNLVKECYFCGSWSPAPCSAPDPPTGCEDRLFCLSPEVRISPADSVLLIFCICTSTSVRGGAPDNIQRDTANRTRLHSVQEAMLQCVQALGDKNPDLRIGLISFNDEVTVHSFGEVPPRVLQGGELSDKKVLQEVGLGFPTPPPLSESQARLQMEIHKLAEGGASALGPAALLSITMASKHPGSKVLVCTHGVPNAGLGRLNPDPSPSHSIVSSSIFYQELSETAAAHGVSVSVVSVGSGCRLNELGRLTDGTGGKVVISSCDDLGEEFMRLIDDRTIGSYCSVTLLLPTVLTVRGERQAGHRVIREVGNITEETEVTFQYGEGERGHALLCGRSVCVQLQVRYRRWDGPSMLRVLTTTLRTTEDSCQALSSLCVSVLLVNAGQTSAALALRGRFRDAQAERDAQKQLIYRAVEHRQNTEDELLFREWLRTTDPIYNNLSKYTHALSDSEAALMFTMKNGFYRTESFC